MPSFSFSAAVNSSSIKGLSYSEDAKVLAVVFHSGLSYMYTGVPKEIAVGLLSSESVGSYHSSKIKGHYAYLKVGLQDQAEMKLSEPHQVSEPEPEPMLAVVAQEPMDKAPARKNRRFR